MSALDAFDCIQTSKWMRLHAPLYFYLFWGICIFLSDFKWIANNKKITHDLICSFAGRLFDFLFFSDIDKLH